MCCVYVPLRFLLFLRVKDSEDLEAEAKAEVTYGHCWDRCGGSAPRRSCGLVFQQLHASVITLGESVLRQNPDPTFMRSVCVSVCESLRPLVVPEDPVKTGRRCSCTQRNAVGPISRRLKRELGRVVFL